MRRLALAILFLFVVPSSASASGGAAFSLGTSSGARVGDEVSVVVTVQGNGESLDTARAFLAFPPDLLSVARVIPGELFPRVSPGNSFDNTSGTVSQGGFVVGSAVDGSGTFATVVFVGKKEGTGTIELLGSSRLISNGEERSTGSGASAAVTIGPASSAPAASGIDAPEPPDAVPPNPIEPYTLRERYLAGDDALLWFATTDDQSGVDHYELSIGNGPYFVATSPYVIADLAAGDLFIQAKAVDRAGNARFGQTTIRAYPAGTELTDADLDAAAREREQMLALARSGSPVGAAFVATALFVAAAAGGILWAIRRRGKRSP